MFNQNTKQAKMEKTLQKINVEYNFENVTGVKSGKKEEQLETH